MKHEFNIIIKSKFKVGDIVKITCPKSMYYDEYRNHLFKIVSINYYIEDEYIKLKDTITTDVKPGLEYTIKNIKNNTLLPYCYSNELTKATKKNKVKYL